MAGEQIFIVEDERIVADDLARILGRLGYNVLGTAASGEEALTKMEGLKPQLVLMDIRIQGAMDGVEVAEHVVAEYDIPVIYLTAYADDTTVDRAKGTLPSGYILKPFDERGLKTTIELALYRHKMDRLMRNVGEWHGGILENLNVAVIAADTKGKVSYMNKMAEAMTGQALEKTVGRPLEDAFNIKISNDKTVPSHLQVVRQGSRMSIDCKESAITDLDGNVIGTALVLKETAPFPNQVPASR